MTEGTVRPTSGAGKEASRGGSLSVIIVEDSPMDVELLLLELNRIGYQVTYEQTQDAEGLGALLERGPWDVVISDFSMPTFSGLGTLEVVSRSGRDVPVIIVSGTIGEETAVKTLQAGACDFLVKGRLARLEHAIERARQDHRTRSERRLLEDQLRQSQRMDAVGKLAGGIAHDFNNLLSVVLAYSEMLMRNLAADDPVRADLDEIRKAGERAAELTRQLLAFSRQQMLAPKVLSLNDVIAGIDRMFRRVIGEDIQLVTLPQAARPLVKVDKGQLEQVLMNLVVNARDAMPTGGKLTIETGNVDLDESYAREHLGVVAGSHVMLAVSDTGCGMDRATQERIFEPFFTTKEQGKGTGLGLSTVFGIVKQSGGSIWVYSEPGKGSTFKIYLPLVAEGNAERSAPPASASQAEALPAEAILLVEDDDQVRVLLCAILRREGYRVLEARDGPSALELSGRESGTIDLMITDVVMPEMSGRDLSERLARTRPDMKVLFVSGYTDNSIVHHGILDPGIAFLQKPITPGALHQKVREVLARKG